MGEYTPFQKFYLIDGEELVSVENDLNYNLHRADMRAYPRLGYQVTDLEAISTADTPKEQGFKWYKKYSNSVWNWQTDPVTGVTNVYQDPNTYVDVWRVDGISFFPGYGSVDQNKDRISYSIREGWVMWRGRLALDGGNSELVSMADVPFLTPPSSVMPTRSRYFTVQGGNATGGDFQMYRVIVNTSSNRFEYVRYGGTSSAQAERYLSLNEIMYPLDDTVI